MAAPHPPLLTPPTPTANAPNTPGPGRPPHEAPRGRSAILRPGAIGDPRGASARPVRRRLARSRLAAAAAAAAAAGILAGCHRQEAGPAAPPVLPTATVRVQTVEAKSRVATEEILGTVRAKLRATIEAKISGRIERMPVVAGQAVTSGALLAQLDAREIQARLEQAKALRDQVDTDRRRYQTLLKDHAVTRQEYDAVETRFRVASASVTEAETVLDHARIEAPFGGVISRKLADQGDLASPGRPLVELEDPARLQFEADIPEGLISRLHLGDALPVRISTLPDPIPGTLGEIAPAADPNSRTFRVKLDLPQGAPLRLGQFGRVSVPVAETTAPRVPASAVVVRGQLELVFVVANRAARMRLVKTGRQLGGDVEILAGIHPGERVVVEGAATLRDGQPVEVK
ncbi:MAG: efflux RND transporter periplasmic adaptor subunit [Verrucomicrobia bacterium]|nr:efflux RND transporter periplasmic adaptor subunit [Verrucomicrobiota bacterium]